MSTDANGPTPISRAGPDSEANIADLWRTLRRQWPPLVGVTIGVTAVVMGVTLLITPAYEGEGTLRVREGERNAGMGMIEEMLPISGMSLPGMGMPDIGTEIGILRSRRIADLVVDSVALHVELSRPWRARRSEIIEVIEAGPDAVRGTYTFRRQTDGAYLTTFRGDDPPPALPERVVIGRPFAVGGMRLVLRSDARDDPPSIVRIRVRPFQRVVSRFRDRFLVSRQDARSQLIEVGYRHADPVIAAGVVNAAIDYFLDFSRSWEQRESRRKVEILGAQVALHETELRRAEERRQRFQETERIIAPEEQASAQVRRIAELQATEDALEVERTALAALLARIASPAANSLDQPAWRQLATFPSFISNGAVQDVLQTLTTLENERAELLGRRTETNRDVRVLDERIAELRGQLQGMGVSYIRGLEDQIAAAESSLADFDEELRAIPAVEVELARLVREQELLNQVYVMLRARLREAEVQEAIDDAAVRVVDRAQVMERPAFPRPLVSLVLASVLGLMAGLFAVLSREAANPHVRSRRDAELAAHGVPLLGAVPPLSRGTATHRGLKGRVRVGPLRIRGPGSPGTDALIARSDPWHPASEAYRAIAGTLFGDPAAATGVIVVTSALPDDGRARLSANLAIALARAGTATVLVDADLRAAETTRLFGLPGGPGWPTPLLHGVSIDEILQHVAAGDRSPSPTPARVTGSAFSTAVHDPTARTTFAGNHDGQVGEVPPEPGPSLDLLPAGPPGPHPAEILGSPVTRALIADLRDRYAAVIIDAPSLHGAFDAATLGGLADGTVLVVRSGATARDAVELAATNLRRARARLAGVVLTEHEPVLRRG